MSGIIPTRRHVTRHGDAVLNTQHVADPGVREPRVGRSIAPGDMRQTALAREPEILGETSQLASHEFGESLEALHAMRLTDSATALTRAETSLSSLVDAMRLEGTLIEHVLVHVKKELDVVPSLLPSFRAALIAHCIDRFFAPSSA